MESLLNRVSLSASSESKASPQSADPQGNTQAPAQGLTMPQEMSTAGAPAPPASSPLVKLQHTAIRPTPTTAVASASQAQPTAAEPVIGGAAAAEPVTGGAAAAEPVTGGAAAAGAAQLPAATSSTEQAVRSTSGAAGTGSTQSFKQQDETRNAAAHRQQQADVVATAGVIPADTEAQSAATIQGGSSSAAEKSAEPDLTSPGSFSA